MSENSSSYVNGIVDEELNSRSQSPTILSCVTSLIGSNVMVETTIGNYKGILKSVSDEFDVALLYAQVQKGSDEEDDNILTSENAKKLMKFESQSVIALHGEIPTRKFEIDSEIVVNGALTPQSGDGCDLEEWKDDEDVGSETENDFSQTENRSSNDGYTDKRRHPKNQGGWCVEDMYKANSELGVVSSFKADLSQYTTVEPHGSEEDKKRAFQLAKEIENNPSSRLNQRLENDDEERDLGVKTEFVDNDDHSTSNISENKDNDDDFEAVQPKKQSHSNQKSNTSYSSNNSFNQSNRNQIPRKASNESQGPPGRQQRFNNSYGTNSNRQGQGGSGVRMQRSDNQHNYNSSSHYKSSQSTQKNYNNQGNNRNQNQNQFRNQFRNQNHNQFRGTNENPNQRPRHSYGFGDGNNRQGGSGGGVRRSDYQNQSYDRTDELKKDVQIKDPVKENLIPTDTDKCEPKSNTNECNEATAIASFQTSNQAGEMSHCEEGIPPDQERIEAEYTAPLTPLESKESMQGSTSERPSASDQHSNSTELICEVKKGSNDADADTKENDTDSGKKFEFNLNAERFVPKASKCTTPVSSVCGPTAIVSESQHVVSVPVPTQPLMPSGVPLQQLGHTSIVASAPLPMPLTHVSSVPPPNMFHHHIPPPYGQNSIINYTNQASIIQAHSIPASSLAHSQHPSQHLKDQLLVNGKQTFAMRNMLYSQLPNQPANANALPVSALTSIAQIQQPTTQILQQALPVATLYPPATITPLYAPATAATVTPFYASAAMPPTGSVIYWNSPY